MRTRKVRGLAKWLALVMFAALVGCYEPYGGGHFRGLWERHRETVPEEMKRDGANADDDGWGLQFGWNVFGGGFGLGLGDDGINWIPLGQSMGGK